MTDRRHSLRRVALLAVGLACSSPAAPTAEGSWGGTEASMVLTATGGSIQYQCGAGTIAAGWTLEATGHLAATGEHYSGGGPVPPQGRPPVPARYSGEVSGSRLTLTVTLTDTGQVLGPYHLVRGGPPVSELCL